MNTMKKHGTNPTARQREKMSRLLSRCQPPNQTYPYPWGNNKSAIDDLLDSLYRTGLAHVSRQDDS